MQERTMRYAIPVLIVFVLGYLVLRTLFSGGATMPPAFEEGLTYEQAVERSAESGRPVLIFATADWCGPCQRLKRGGLADRRVTDAILERVEPVYLDLTTAGADGDSTARIADELNVQGIPALILVRNGRELSRKVGVVSATDLLGWIESH